MTTVARARRAVPDSVADLLPTPDPIRFLEPDGRSTSRRRRIDAVPRDPAAPAPRMVLGRRFDTQATALTKQGRLAVYPSARGQEACQVGAVAALGERDWLFPTYRDSMAMVARGRRPGRGADAAARRLALRLRPVPAPRRAAVHAAGHQHPARRRPRARGPAARARTPSRWCCSATAPPARATPTRRSTSPRSGRRRWSSWCRTTATPSACRWPSRPGRTALADKGVGYGMPGVLVDGNDAAAVYAAVTEAVERGAAPAAARP